MNQVVAIVGLCGAGKSMVSDYFVRQGFSYLRFGQITFDEIQRRGLEPNATNEKEVREGLRKEHGMAVFATLSQPKIDQLLSENKSVLVDGLYSWAEYKILKEKYGAGLTVVAVYASPELRYDRLEHRKEAHANDPDTRFRSFTRTEAQARDYAEIENIEKAGPIVMADYTILNIGTLRELEASTEEVRKAILSKA